MYFFLSKTELFFSLSLSLFPVNGCALSWESLAVRATLKGNLAKDRVGKDRVPRDGYIVLCGVTTGPGYFKNLERTGSFQERISHLWPAVLWPVIWGGKKSKQNLRIMVIYKTQVLDFLESHFRIPKNRSDNRQGSFPVSNKHQTL